MKRITHDFETRSACDLKKAGAYKYSLHPTTQPTCFSFKDHDENFVWFLKFEEINRRWGLQPDELQNRWMNCIKEGYEFSAHNSFFERCIYDNIMVKRYGWPRIPPKQRRCTAAKAAACALPRNLEGAGAALNLSVQKDKRGFIAMMRTCRPTKYWNAWKKLQDKVKLGAKITAKSRLKAEAAEPKMFLDYEDDPQTWETLYEYNRIDTRAEEAVDQALPDLIPSEQEIWLLNQEINWRGLRVDIPTIRKVVEIMAVESKTKLKELDHLTMGLVTKPGARVSILEFLELEGISLPNLQAKTVDDSLSGFKLSGDMHRLLEIRKALSLTSTKKYQAFLNRATEDGRVRDLLLYHGASTGRDTGTGIQPHNFPRGLLPINKARPYAHVENVVECAPEMLHLIYGESLGLLFSAILRNMILPSKGCELFVADFSKVEVAVLWWLSDNEAGLRILREGKDPYIYQAAKNLGKTYNEIEIAFNAGESWAFDARQLGKAQVLGNGFGMGWRKFKKAALDMYRLKLTAAQAIAAVKSYRESNSRVTELWKEYEIAAISAVQTGKLKTAGKCAFKMKDGFLWVQLPSGRRLAYAYPTTAWRVRTVEIEEFGTDPKTGEEIVVSVRTEQLPPQETLEFWAVNSKTKKWAQERTWGGTLAENITQAVARDLMMSGMVNCEKAGYRALLTVHDEMLSERRIGEGSVEGFTKTLCTRPKWGLDLPLEAKGWQGPRYRK